MVHIDRTSEATLRTEPKKETAVPKGAPEKPKKNNPPSATKTPTPSPSATKLPAAQPFSKADRPSEANTPADSASENERIGKRLCFMKGNWSEGLPKLAASADERLTSLAQKELAAPEDKAERLAVADGWWAVSEKYAAPADKTIRRHAVEWYQKIIGELEGEDRDRAELRISRETPPPPGEKPPVNPEELE